MEDYIFSKVDGAIARLEAEKNRKPTVREKLADDIQFSLECKNNRQLIYELIVANKHLILSSLRGV